MVGAYGGIPLHQDAAPLREKGLDLADVEANVRKVRARCRRLAPVDRLFRGGVDTQSRGIVPRNDCHSFWLIASFKAFSRLEVNS
jgi:hypothetical protein